MRFQVVHHQRNAFGVRIACSDILHEHGPVQFGLPPACQRLAGHEDIAHAAAFVFVD